MGGLPGALGPDPGTASAALLGPQLPRVMQAAPVAVLIIDVSRRQVVYANPTAVELTGDRLRLPMDIDAWGDAAGLTDLAGRRMGETGSPLSLVLGGTPVTGEPVAVHDAARRGSTATAEQCAPAEGRLLWATGFPLAGADSGLADRALLMFQEISGHRPDGASRLAALRDRAVVATALSFTITDPRRPDDPLVWVNPSFTRLTGWSHDDVVGRNCRLLQGANTDRAAVDRISAALCRRRPVTEVLLNYRRDGSAFWNELSISPVFDGAGELVNFVGVQTDVTERVVVEQERRAALAEAEEARTQLRLLAEATTQMTGALDVADACVRLARSLVPGLADLCAVDLLDRSGADATQRRAVAARDAADEVRLRRLGELRGHRQGPAIQIGSVLAGGDPVVVPELPEHGADQFPDDPETAAVYDRLRLRSLMVVPLRARGRVVGALTLFSQHPYGRRYGPRDLHLAADIAGRAGLTVDNARLYETEHAAAATLQHSLLPAVPRVPGLQIAARYLVGMDGNQVGGDWYDVLNLPDGAVGVAVGDVVGHDLRAAAAMGQLRAVLRSYAWDGGRPGSVLDRCDQLVQGLEMAAMATAVYARLEPPDAGGERLLSYANAGHPAPVLLGPEGTLRRLDAHLSPMIGAVPSLGRGEGPGRTEVTVRCPPGSVLVLYTDGLTDVAGEDPDERTELLERTIAGLPPGAAAETVAEEVIRVCAPSRVRDDVALLAVRLAP
jgi:PAS domain S-box-containing protein